MSGSERLAAIDVGSNTILLTVADFAPDAGLTVVEEGEDQARLGAGLASTGRLGEAPMGRALDTLAAMRDTCRRLGVQRLSAVATAAVREAVNGSDFVQRVRALGVPLRIISPEIEASLAYRSAAYRFPDIERMLVADIGGGSLELIGAGRGQLLLSRSLPLGAVRLTESGGSAEEIRDHIARGLGQAGLQEWRGSRLIGSGGTFATLASMALAQSRVSQPIHGTVITRAEVEQLSQTLAAMTPAQRRQVPGLPAERADIIGAGLAVVLELLATVKAERVMVSGFGLRDGLLLEMVEATPRTESRCS